MHIQVSVLVNAYEHDILGVEKIGKILLTVESTQFHYFIFVMMMRLKQA